MNQKGLTREEILGAISSALQPLDYTQAMWEGGAAAFGRLDQWSDMDLMIVVDDEHVADAFQVIEQTLAGLGIIDLKYEIPQPAWHGLDQRFYHLQGTDRLLLLDIAVIKSSQPNKFIQPEIHGNAVIYFDKAGIVQSPDLDWQAHAAMLRERLATLKVTFDLFQAFPLKELQRGNHIEAVAYYHSFILRPLVEALRIRHQPARYNFYTRYIYYDLPAEVVDSLEPFFFVSGPGDLSGKHQAAVAWFDILLAELNEVDPISHQRGA